VTRGATMAVVVGLLLCTGRAHADEAGSALEVDRCAATPATLTDAERAALGERAGNDYERAEVLYVQGDYAGAITAFVASYCTLPYYTVLKDIGQAYERLLDYERAIAYLERYVAAVPTDAQRDSACAVDPVEDRANVEARVRVLAGLPAKLRVTTTPTGAAITLRRDDTVVARGLSGAGIVEARAGRYTMTVERAGFLPITSEVEPEIGKPYSYYFQLEPRRGQLRVRVQPGDARVFVDERLVGIGDVDLDLAGGSYQVMVEAVGRGSETRAVTVSADDVAEATFALAAPPRTGRTQLLVAGGVAGLVVGTALGDGINVDSGAGVGLLLGTAAGAAGTYLAVPDDIPLGDSSYIITAGLTGSVLGGATAGMAGGDQATVSIGGSVGLLAGAAVGIASARRLDLSPGDAAIFNSGALWGGVSGALFSVVFDGSSRLGSVMVATGVGTGVLTGALLGRTFEPTRREVVLVDLAGVGGAAAAAAIQSVASDGGATSAESRAHFALAGMSVGLVGGALLLRLLETPTTAPTSRAPSGPRVVPTVTPGPGGATVGLAGAW